MLGNIKKKVLALGALNCVFNLVFLLRGMHLSTYDVYPHLFFAQHYVSNWFNFFNYKWYGGFYQTAYPPLVHQMLAALMFLFSPEGAVFVLLEAFFFVFPYTVYTFCRLWNPPRASFLAAALSTLFSIFPVFIYRYGQLTTIAAVVFVMMACVHLFIHLRTGSFKHAALFVLSFTLVGCMHPFTFFFGQPVFIGMVAVYLISKSRTPFIVTPRFIMLIVPAVFVYWLAMFPYLEHIASLPYTVPIPHLSRENVFHNDIALAINLLLPCGVNLVFLLLIFFPIHLSSRVILHGATAFLFIMGLGGTTPLPSMLLGNGMFNTLTFDRFLFWANITLLPLLAGYMHNIYKLRRTKLVYGIFGVYLIAYVVTMGVNTFLKYQPRQLDMQEMSQFLNQSPNSKYSYITLGFGDQFTRLNMQAQAPTLDGNYNKERAPNHIRMLPIEKLDNTKYYGPESIWGLEQIIALPQRYSLKFILSNDRYYDSLLIKNGWQRKKTFANGVDLWETPLEVPPVSLSQTKEVPDWEYFWWGYASPAAFIAYLAVGFLFRRSALRRPQP